MKAKYLFLAILCLFHFQPAQAMTQARTQADSERPIKGPPISWYQTLWGHYPEMRRMGASKFVNQMVKEYGSDGTPVRVGFGPKTMYILTDPKDVEAVLLNQQAFSKGFMVKYISELLLGKGMAVLEHGDQWKKLHRYMAPHFFASKIQDYFQTVNHHAEQFVAELKEKGDSLGGAPLDLEREMRVFTMGGISKTMLSMDLTHKKAKELSTALSNILEFIHYRNLNYPFNYPLMLPSPANAAYYESLQVVRDYVGEMLENDEILEARGEGNGSLIRAFRLARREAQPIPQYEGDTLELSDSELLDQVVSVFFGGHETTAHLLTMSLFHLTQNPEVKSNLLAELKKFDETPLTQHDQTGPNELPYLNAFLNEVLRMDPSIPIFLREANETVEINGIMIPTGTLVMFPVEGLHHSETYWESPEKFDPSRFLNTKYKGAFKPFGFGPRGCIGRHFALNEAKLFLIHWLRSGIQFDLAPGAQVETTLVCTSRLKNGLPLVLSGSNPPSECKVAPEESEEQPRGYLWWLNSYLW